MGSEFEKGTKEKLFLSGDPLFLFKQIPSRKNRRAIPYSYILYEHFYIQQIYRGSNPYAHQCGHMPLLTISPTCPSGSVQELAIGILLAFQVYLPKKYTLLPPLSQSIVECIWTPLCFKYSSHLSTSSRFSTAKAKCSLSDTSG